MPAEVVELLLKMTTDHEVSMSSTRQEYKIKLSDAWQVRQRWMLAKYRSSTDSGRSWAPDHIRSSTEYEKPREG